MVIVRYNCTNYADILNVERSGALSPLLLLTAQSVFSCKPNYGQSFTYFSNNPPLLNVSYVEIIKAMLKFYSFLQGLQWVNIPIIDNSIGEAAYLQTFVRQGNVLKLVMNLTKRMLPFKLE